MRGKGSYWKEVPPPRGWDPRWPAIFLLASDVKWEETEDGPNVSMHTLVNGVCNGPIVSEELQKTSRKTDAPALWALVPIGCVRLPGEGSAPALPSGAYPLEGPKLDPGGEG